MGRPLQLQSAVQHSDSQTRPAVPDSGHQMPGPALSQCGRHRQPRLPECGRGQQFQAVAKGCQQGSLQRAPVSSTASCSHSGRCQQFYTVAPPSSRQLHASCSHSGSSQQFQAVALPSSSQLHRQLFSQWQMPALLLCGPTSSSQLLCQLFSQWQMPAVSECGPTSSSQLHHASCSHSGHHHELPQTQVPRLPQCGRRHELPQMPVPRLLQCGRHHHHELPVSSTRHSLPGRKEEGR